MCSTRRSILILLVLLVANCVALAKPQSRIRQVDFSNFTFPKFWGDRAISLKNGKLEFESQGCHTEYKLKDVTYRDLTRDGNEEALVRIEDFTACGSSGRVRLSFTRSRTVAHACSGGSVQVARARRLEGLQTGQARTSFSISEAVSHIPGLTDSGTRGRYQSPTRCKSNRSYWSS